MDFLKKNWAKICVAVLGLVGLIYFFLLLVNVPSGDGMSDSAKKDLTSITMTALAGIVFFLALTANAVLAMFDKTKPYTKWVLIGAGALATIFMIIAFANGADSLKELKDAIKLAKDMGDEAVKGARFAYYHTLVPYVAYTILFGLLPLVKGVKKALKKDA